MVAVAPKMASFSDGLKGGEVVVEDAEPAGVVAGYEADGPVGAAMRRCGPNDSTTTSR